MDERRQEFQVGLMAVVALIAAVIMVFQFGEIGNRWKSGTRISVVMPSAAGIYPESAVRMSGIRIGHVESVHLVAEGRGVMVQVLIDSEHIFRDDSTAVVTRSLLGDGSIEIVPGTQGKPVTNGVRIAGRTASDPMQMVARLEERVGATLASFEHTGQQWGKLGSNLNRFLETTGPDNVNTMERSAAALEQFTRTMKAAERTLAAAGSIIGDPQYQQQLQATLIALPELLNDTRTTLQTVNQVVGQLEVTVTNINTATTPLAQQSEGMIQRLNQSLANIEVMTGELAVVSKLMNQNDGTIRKLVTDPSMYRNLNATSASLAVLLENLKPIMADLQVFSDRVARHPELLGIRGVVRGSDGTKDTDIVPAGFER